MKVRIIEYSSIQEINYRRIHESTALHLFLLFPHVEITIDIATTDFSFLRSHACIPYTDVTYQNRFIRAALLWKISDVLLVAPYTVVVIQKCRLKHDSVAWKML